MTTTDDAPGATAEEAPPAPGPDPAAIGLPMFCVGSIALALYLFGFVGAAPIAFIVIFVNGLGLLVGGIWAAALGATAVAGLFVVFAGFWSSLGFTALGLANGWFGAEVSVAATFETFLISWLVVFVVITLGVLRLPIAFTGIMVFVCAAVALVLAGVAAGSTALLTIAGICVLIFAAIGLYLVAGSYMASAGGKGLSPGPPLVK